jgi:hypothetical protein
MSQLEVDKVIPQSGTTLTLGDSADTITIPSGATLDASNATLTLPDDSVTTAKIDDGAVTSAKITYPLTTFSSTGIDDDGTSTAITINSSNNVALAGNIGLGGATPTTSGTGITFPATVSASTNANTLDDYEEGTFTPTWSSGTATYISQVGKYTKIGNVVYFNINIKSSSVTSMTSVNINGLPFTAVNLTDYFATCANFPVFGFENLGSAGIGAQISLNGTQIALYIVSQSSGANYNSLDNTEVNEGSNLEIAITGHYYV